MKIRIALFAALFFLAASNIYAQHHGRHHGPRLLDAIDEMGEDLQLSNQQQAQLETLKKDMEADMQALHEQDFEDHAAKREAFHNTMASYKEKVNEILTDEQETMLKEKRKERMHKRHEQMKNVDKEEMRAALRAHHDQEVLPVLLAKRAEFDKELSTDDRAKIAELRAKFKIKKAEHRAKREEMRKRMKEDGEKHPHHHREHRGHGPKTDDPDHQALKALLDKYDAELTAVMESLAPQQEQWKKERDAILQKFMPEDAPAKREGRHLGKFGHKAMKKGHFLLLDPNATPSIINSKTTVINAIKAYPNPASSNITLSYELLQDGNVKIELRNESGGTIKVLEEARKKSGAQQLNIDVSSLRDGVYYIAIISGGGQSIVKTVIAKQ